MKYVYIVHQGYDDCLPDGGSTHEVVAVFEDLSKAIEFARTLKPRECELHDKKNKYFEFYRASSSEDWVYEWVGVSKEEVR
jgi:hypothetical protein